MIYHIMHPQAPWDNADSGSYLSTSAGLGLVSTWMGVCLGMYFNVFTLTHAFGFASLRSK
jgi:hypothetical protein